MEKAGVGEKTPKVEISPANVAKVICHTQQSTPMSRISTNLTSNMSAVSSNLKGNISKEGVPRKRNKTITPIKLPCSL